MGVAWMIAAILKPEIESGQVEWDVGTWLQPVKIRRLTIDEAIAIEDLCTEHQIKFKRTC
jgi:hypothetical protein